MEKFRFGMNKKEVQHSYGRLLKKLEWVELMVRKADAKMEELKYGKEGSYELYCNFQKQDHVSKQLSECFMGEAGILQYTQRLLGFCRYHLEKMEDAEEVRRIYRSLVTSGIDINRNKIKKAFENEEYFRISPEQYFHNLNMDSFLTAFELKRTAFEKLKREITNESVFADSHKEYLQRLSDYEAEFQNLIRLAEEEITHLEEIRRQLREDLGHMERDPLYNLYKIIFKKIESGNIEPPIDGSLSQMIMVTDKMTYMLRGAIEDAQYEDTGRFWFAFYETELAIRETAFQASDDIECRPALMRGSEVVYMGKAVIEGGNPE